MVFMRLVLEKSLVPAVDPEAYVIIGNMVLLVDEAPELYGGCVTQLCRVW
jgi:hypothetical protein